MKKHVLMRRLTLIMLMFVSSVFCFGQIYVKQTATGSADGSSWDNAYGNSQLGTAITSAAGKTVYVAASTTNYSISTTIPINTNVSVIGGFPASSTGTDISQYNPGANITKITGTPTYLFSIASASNATSVTLKGLEIYSAPKGVLSVNNASKLATLNLTDLNVYNNSQNTNTGATIDLTELSSTSLVVNVQTSTFTSNTGVRAGVFYIYNTKGTVNIDNCIFKTNSYSVGSTSNSAGAIWMENGGKLNITSTCFTKNKAYSDGGALSVKSVTSATISSSSFYANEANSSGQGGAINNFETNLTISNSQFQSNTALYGTAVYVYGDKTAITDSDFYTNNGTSSSDGAVSFKEVSSVASYSITRGTFANNSRGGVIVNSGTLTIRNAKFLSNAAFGAKKVSGSLKVYDSYFRGVATTNALINADTSSNNDIASAAVSIPAIFLQACCLNTQPSIAGTANTCSVGVSTLATPTTDFPSNKHNAFIGIESATKGMVITRTTSGSITAANLVPGMLIYDTNDKCVKLYSTLKGASSPTWHCISKLCVKYLTQ